MRNRIPKLLLLAISSCITSPAFADGTYTIYPIPQQQVSLEGKAKLSAKVNVIFESGVDEFTRKRLLTLLSEHHIDTIISEKSSTSMSNVFLGINGSKEIADNLATEQNINRSVFDKKNKYDRHFVGLTSNNGLAQILILGENTDATFFGIASLEQMLDTDLGNLPCVSIYDYADQKSRGIVEGYYGYPYTVEVKKDLMRYMMRFKMNTYMYGAKSDPYHSLYWKNPYPLSLTELQVKNGWLSQNMVKELTEISHDTKVNFIWAIHPGNNIMNSSSVVSDVMSKFDKMYQLGVRQFAVFVDDVGVPNSDTDMNKSATNVANIQRQLENKYNKNYTAAIDTVRPLHFVPQVYCSSWVGEDQRKRFFKSLQRLPSNITVYTTGWGVWSVPNQNDFNLTAKELGRPAAWWWNYPCNDNADAQVYPMDMYSNFYDMPSVDNNARLPRELNNGLGIVCNPMQQGEISKIPIFSAADYAWNTSGFNNIKSWNASFATIVGEEKAISLQHVARYLRWNDPEDLNRMINAYKQGLNHGNPDISKLKATMDELSEACHTIEGLKESEKQSDRLLYADLSPWLLKLKQMSVSVSNLLDASAQKDGNVEKWNKYVTEIKPVAALDTAERYKVYSLEGMGENIPVGVRQSATARRYLYPFTQYLKENALGKFFKPISPDQLSFITNNKNLKGKVNLVNDTVSLTDKVYTLGKGEYVGFTMPNPRKVADVILADSLQSNHCVLYSSNGKKWEKLTSKKAFLDDYVKYVCVINEKDDKITIQLPSTSFGVVLGDPTKIENVQLPEGPIWNEGGYLHGKELMMDGDYTTYTCLYRCQQNNDKYTLELNKNTPIYDVRICMGTVNGDHMNSGYVEVSEDKKSWKKIFVKGTNIYDFTINMSQAIQFSNEMKYCDFDGKGIKAKYVRFCLKSPRTDKWLRFYEMEVNKQHESLVKNATIPNGPIWQNHNKELMYDGILSTFVCLNKNQNHGDRYTLNLKSPTKINDVRVYMGTTNGDHMNKGNIEVSKDGRVWKKLKVKGTDTFDFTMNMPETVKYSDDVYYCDFTGNGEEMQHIRFVVKDARTDKWLRLYEIAVNPNENSNREVCVASDGSSVKTLNDGKGYTGISKTKQSLTYYFNSLNLMNAVEIYLDGSLSETNPAKVKVTSDEKEWKDYGMLTSNKHIVDLSQQKDAVAMKIEWNELNAPAIYEIVPVLDKTKFAEVTKIEQITKSIGNASLSFKGRHLLVHADSGIISVDMFTLDGKSVLSYQANGASDIQIPTLISYPQAYLVKVKLSNQTIQVYKILYK